MATASAVAVPSFEAPVLTCEDCGHPQAAHHSYYNNGRSCDRDGCDCVRKFEVSEFQQAWYELVWRGHQGHVSKYRGHPLLIYYGVDWKEGAKRVEELEEEARVRKHYGFRGLPVVLCEAGNHHSQCMLTDQVPLRERLFCSCGFTEAIGVHAQHSKVDPQAEHLTELDAVLLGLSHVANAESEQKRLSDQVSKARTAFQTYMNKRVNRRIVVEAAWYQMRAALTGAVVGQRLSQDQVKGLEFYLRSCTLENGDFRLMLFVPNLGHHWEVWLKQISHLEFPALEGEETCHFCGKPWEGTFNHWVGDPPGLCAQDHKPPTYANFTRCCRKVL